jgi:hypothetical protein
VSDGNGGRRDGQANPGRIHVRYQRVGGGRRYSDPRHAPDPLDLRASYGIRQAYPDLAPDQRSCRGANVAANRQRECPEGRHVADKGKKSAGFFSWEGRT